jgi:acetyltransferase-like isoleucine patch superfamily enzyme
VIGANSVVTGEIPAYTVAAGVPARVIKEMTLKEMTIEDGPR